MKNSVESMLKHPIATSIIVGSVLGGIAGIIREIRAIYEACNSNK